MSDASQQAQAQAPGVGGTMLQVEELPAGVLEALGQNRATSSLKPTSRKAAEELASRITLNNTDDLLKQVEGTLAKVSATSNEMIGEARLGELGYVNQIFSNLTNVEEKLDVAAVHRPMGPVRKFLVWALGQRGLKWFHPLFRLLERYKTVKGMIAEQKKECQVREARQITIKEQAEKNKEATIENFHAYEIMIAAGELVIEAARKAFQEQLTALRASATPNDTITLARLKEMRKKIVGLDKRVTKMQVMRVDMIVALESLDMLVDNANNLRQTLFDIRVQNIPALEQAVGIAFSVYEQRQTAQFGSRVEDQQMRTRQANIEALGHSQEEVHKASMAHVDQAAAIVKALEDLGRVRARGTELLVIAEKANAEVRAKLAEAERKFKEDAQADLEKSAT